MSITSKQKYELKKFVKELSSYRGRHTELVTVYIPQGYEMSKIINHLSQEQGTASNIKSASTRKNVIDALERMIQHLRIYKGTPENGLCAFSGNVSGKEGQQDVKVWSIEPPVPIKTRIYRCDKQFLLDILEDMLEVKNVYGFIVMDRREANIAVLKGKTIIPLTNTTSNVPGKTRAGGQSAARYMRLREDAAKDFYKKIAQMVKEQFLMNSNIKGIIVGGPGPTKLEFVDGNYLTGDIKKKIIAVKDISYTGDFGLNELLEKSEDVLASEEVIFEKKLMQRFFELLSKKPAMVTYGLKEAKRYLEMGVVDKLLVSEEIEDDTVKELDGIAKHVGSEVIIVSTETREGAQLRDMGGIAAILRYEAAVS